MKYPTADEIRDAHDGDAMARWNRSYIVDPNGCWRWVASRTSSGYGHFHVLGSYYQAHRVSYVLHLGQVPDGLTIDHLCRNRACVNPAHLEPVTITENIRRASRLTPTLVAELRDARAAGAGVRALARQHGVHHASVSRAIRGLTWAKETAA